MIDDTQDDVWYVPPATYVPSRPSRISGTAVFGGVHLSSGNYGTAPVWQLFLSGFGIVFLLALGMVLTYVEAWVIDQFTGLSLASNLLGLAGHSSSPWQPYGEGLLLVLPMLNFLVMLRLSPLSGYHAAEHKVVAAIEQYGEITWEQVVEMPRAHPRCGTVLLFGILPALLIAYPLLFSSPLTAVLVALIGWMLRYRVGYFIQQNFTTKPPTPAQLRAGLEAGRKLLHVWRTQPNRRVSIAKNVWTRGFPQMLAGLILGQHLLSFVHQHLHLWLDW
jgi:hypothetical protein